MAHQSLLRSMTAGIAVLAVCAAMTPADAQAGFGLFARHGHGQHGCYGGGYGHGYGVYGHA